MVDWWAPIPVWVFIYKFLCSVTHPRKLKKDNCSDINILGKWELQTVLDSKKSILEPHWKPYCPLEKNKILGTSQDKRLPFYYEILAVHTVLSCLSLNKGSYCLSPKMRNTFKDIERLLPYTMEEDWILFNVSGKALSLVSAVQECSIIPSLYTQ